MIIWLASYPKSGNTWVRSFLTSILYSIEGNINFNDLNKLGAQYPLRSQFKNFVKDFNNINEIKNEWINTQDFLNLDNKTKFFKTHHVNCKIGSSTFTNLNNTLGVIYIVRDPRNVITSILHHYHKSSYQEAKQFLFDEHNWLGFIKNEYEKNLEKKIPTPISSWQNHYKSWIKREKNLLLIKYENLISNPNKEFSKIIKYIENSMEIKIDEEKINRAVHSCSFKNLSELELKSDFAESVIDKKKGKKKKFFNLGPSNDWKKLLDKDIRLEIEEKFKDEMLELGYL